MMWARYLHKLFVGEGGCGLASLQRGFPKMQFHILRILAVDWRYEGSEYY